MSEYTYNNKGLYNKYNKAHKEREELDYYATPVNETTNILNQLDIDFNGMTILEPAAGGGHMVQGILDYLNNKKQTAKVIGTDVRMRDVLITAAPFMNAGDKYDFLADNYPISQADYVIMNPPYSAIIPFVLRGLEIAQKGLLLLARVQFLEGKERYDIILKNNPPSDIYIYVDRIKCYKNGDFSQTESSAQCYAWFYWDKETTTTETHTHWIRRA